MLSADSCCTFLRIKLRKKVPGKQINAYENACTDKNINCHDPPSGKTGVVNQPVEKKIIRDILRTMGKRDENKIKHQQENGYCHAEQADKGNELPVAPENP
jgi:hypothetical protein